MSRRRHSGETVARPRRRHSIGRFLVSGLLMIGAVALGPHALPGGMIAGAIAKNAMPPPAPTKPGLPRAGPYVVLVVIDAARFDELIPSRMPNLARLLASGTSYANAFVGALPALTETSHATIGTGVLPDRHDILGHTWRVPGTEHMAPNLLDGSLDHTGYIGKFIRATGSPALADFVHRAYPGSRVVAVSGHKSYAADALGAGAADYVAFGVRDARGHFVPGGTSGHVPARAILKSPQLDMPTYPRKPGVEDDWTTTLALKFLFKYHPRLLMINLPEVDTFGHIAGTDSVVMQPLLESVDRQLGRLVAAYGRSNLLGQTTFIVTSDHGMVPALHAVDIQVVQKAIAAAGGQALYTGHGDYCPIWLKNAEAIPRVASALSANRIPNVAAVYMRSPNGRYTLASPASRLASPLSKRSYDDLLQTFGNLESPDIVLLYDENTWTRTQGAVQSGWKGDHAGATWGSQHIPLILSGPAIQPRYVSSYPATLADIAPTVETILGVKPADQDGVPLADSLLDAPSWATQLQAARTSRAVADVRGLETEANLRPNQRP